MEAARDTARDFEKVLHIGTAEYGRVFCKVEFKGGRLSITGVEGPKSNGDALGNCGQITPTVTTYAEGWDALLLEEFKKIWDEWHLNDMRAGCEHQRATWNLDANLEIVSYGLTTEAYQERSRLRTLVAKAVGRGEPVPELSAQEKALLALDRWYANIHQPPDADSPLSGCYEVKKRETKRASWVLHEEHPEGCLSRPCETCGYKYGSKWLREEVPADVLAFLRGLPDSTVTPAWV